MSNDLNSCQFIGRLGKDPGVKFTPDERQITTFSIAVGESWKSQQGQKQEKTTWVNIVVFGPLAKVCGDWLKKGSQVYVSGKFSVRKWQDKTTGADRYSTEVVLDNFTGRMQMLGGGESKPNQQTQNQSQQGYQQQDNQQKQSRPAPPPDNQPQGAFKEDPDFDSDVPF